MANGLLYCTAKHVESKRREASALQAERYSIAWFVWPRDGAVIQGPKKKYPPTTMRDFMRVRASLKAMLNFHSALDTPLHGHMVEQPTPQVQSQVCRPREWKLHGV